MATQLPRQIKDFCARCGAGVTDTYFFLLLTVLYVL